MNKAFISTDKAPAAIGPYNQAILSNNTLYMSGQIAINPENGELVLDSIKSETHRVLQNMGEVLKEAGMNYQNVICVKYNDRYVSILQKSNIAVKKDQTLFVTYISISILHSNLHQFFSNLTAHVHHLIISCAAYVLRPEQEL